MKHWNDHSIVKSGSSAECHTFSVNRGLVNTYDEKSNEISAIPRLLTLLDIENCIITLDAMGCQKDIAKQIVKGKADYILALKAVGSPRIYNFLVKTFTISDRW